MRARDYDLMLVEVALENLKLEKEWREEMFGVDYGTVHSQTGRELGEDRRLLRGPTELSGIDEGESGDLGLAGRDDNQYPEIF